MARRWRLLPDDPEIGWAPYVWLFYLVFLLLAPVFGDLHGVRVWGATAAACIVFLPLYFAAYWVEYGRRLALALGMAALGAALAPINAGASVFFIYSAYFAGISHDRPSRSLPAVGLVLVLTLLTGGTLAPNLYFLGPATLGVLVIGLLGIHFSQRMEQLAELRMARAEVEALARIAERDRIAGDLHDLLGHTLSVIALKSELAAALVSRDGARARAEAEEIQAIARRALSEVRTAVRGYRAGSGASLQQELDGAERALATAGVELRVEAGPARVAERIDAAHESVMALALREAATNVMRHARASRCWVSFFDEGDTYGVEVRDDGRGLRGRLGHGLSGMRQRVEALDGRLDLKSGEGGTTLRLRFRAPIPADDEGVAG